MPETFSLYFFCVLIRSIRASAVSTCAAVKAAHLAAGARSARELGRLLRGWGWQRRAPLRPRRRVVGLEVDHRSARVDREAPLVARVLEAHADVHRDGEVRLGARLRPLRALVHRDHLAVELQPAVQLPLLESPLLHRAGLEGEAAAVADGLELVEPRDELLLADLAIVVGVQRCGAHHAAVSAAAGTWSRQRAEGAGRPPKKTCSIWASPNPKSESFMCISDCERLPLPSASIDLNTALASPAMAFRELFRGKAFRPGRSRSLRVLVARLGPTAAT